MTTKTRNLKQTIKKHAPEIVAVTGTVAIVATYVYFARKTMTPEVGNFFKNAADPTVEIILGNDDAFVVMTDVAMQHLHELGSLTIHDGTAGVFKLMFTENM